MKRKDIWIPASMFLKLARVAVRTGQKPHEIVRLAVEEYLESES